MLRYFFLLISFGLLFSCINKKALTAKEPAVKTTAVSKNDPFLTQSLASINQHQQVLKMYQEDLKQCITLNADNEKNRPLLDAAKAFGEELKETQAALKVFLSYVEDADASKILSAEDMIKGLYSEIVLAQEKCEGTLKTFSEAHGETFNFSKYSMEPFYNELPIANLITGPWKDLGFGSWEAYQFEGKTMLEASLIVKQIQNNLLNSEIQWLRFLANDALNVNLSYDRFTLFSNAKTHTIKKGETFNSEIQLGAYASQAKFSVSVDGTPLKIVDGIAQYFEKVLTAGKQNYTAIVSVQNPLTGETTTIEKTYYYYVSE